ncbi:MAG: ComF family protein [Clostridium sp.]|nr:ComF family protein [Clostridium sp.]
MVEKYVPRQAGGIFRDIKSAALDILFPRRCPVCFQIVLPKGALICPDCIRKLSWVRRPTCKKCGKEVIADTIEYCFDCSKGRRTFEWGAALINYDERAGRSMAAIKYKNKREYLDFYSEAMCRKLGKRLLSMKADALVPVPVHSSRMRARGFNQAQELACGISQKLGIPMDTSILKRSRKTVPQKNLDPAARLKNLEQAFTAGPVPPHIRRVILIDDIYTTGSTIEACTRVLRSAGVEKVYFAVIFIGNGQ